jgi:hypothetical protein
LGARLREDPGGWPSDGSSSDCFDGADAEVRANRGMHGEINRLWSDLNGAPALKDLQSMLSVGPIGQTVHDLLAVFLSDRAD